MTLISEYRREVMNKDRDLAYRIPDVFRLEAEVNLTMPYKSAICEKTSGVEPSHSLLRVAGNGDIKNVSTSCI